MKLKTKCIINTGLYMHIETEIEIDVPDDLKNEALVQYLHKTYHGLLNHKPACGRCGGVEQYGGQGLNEEGLCKRCESENFFQEKENRSAINKK